MESRKDMVMFMDGGQLGTLVGKRVSNLSEAVGSPLAEPPEKMVPRACLSPRAGAAGARERAGGPAEEAADGLAGSAAGPGAEARGTGATVLGPGPPASCAEGLSGQGQPSSSDTESDFYEEIEVSCTPDCATGSAEYQHSKGSRRVPLPVPGPPSRPPATSTLEGRRRHSFLPMQEVWGTVLSRNCWGAWEEGVSGNLALARLRLTAVPGGLGGREGEP